MGHLTGVQRLDAGAPDFQGGRDAAVVHGPRVCHHRHQAKPLVRGQTGVHRIPQLDQRLLGLRRAFGMFDLGTSGLTQHHHGVRGGLTAAAHHGCVDHGM